MRQLKCIERRLDMQKNILKSGIEISELGLGCMSLGTDYKKAQNLRAVIKFDENIYEKTSDIKECKFCPMKYYCHRY